MPLALIGRITYAQFINHIIQTLPGVVFESIIEKDDDATVATVLYAHHIYEIYADVKKGYDVIELIRKDNWEHIQVTAYSERIEGLLRGWKRNEEGRLIPQNESNQ